MRARLFGTLEYVGENQVLKEKSQKLINVVKKVV